LEWKYVFLAHVNEGVIPTTKREIPGLDYNVVDEERRLLYVGMSRAMDTLWITFTSKVSPFIEQNEAMRKNLLKRVVNQEMAGKKDEAKETV
ncbi:hypothetical protein PROFUN_13446, partial [Planoprotostelium fungivorum]